jgi:hypothetical protein
MPPVRLAAEDGQGLGGTPRTHVEGGDDAAGKYRAARGEVPSLELP